MPAVFDSIIVLAIVLVVARFIKRGSGVLQKFFIPSALVAGFIGLILGPQVLGTIPADVTNYWAQWPKHLITVVFAGLFLGKVIPRRKEIWKLAGPQIAFGNTVAWGQYVVGILLTVLVLTPIFGSNPLAGTLIEVSFEGGHGTAAGLAPTFAELGWADGTDLALALATVSILMAIAVGIILVNWHNRHGQTHTDPEEITRQRRQMVRSGYNLITFSRKLHTNPKAVLINIAAFAAAIGLGWGLLQGLIKLEDIVLNPHTDLRFFTFMPLFPLAMLGGLIVQLVLRKFNKQSLIQRRTAEIFSSLALDILVATAVATVSLRAIGNNLPVFIGLAIAGFVWIMACFFLLAPRMFPTFWFEKGLTNIGQSMGMTATGLLLGRLVDPNNHSKARESFSYKQLVFEPFMGGGIITVSAVIFVYELGTGPVLAVASMVTIFWLIVGLYLGRKKKK